tara:strand:- start:3366 stop:6023 length:2658 start_codon:yes stop_codon:yes gene_type:complete
MKKLLLPILFFMLLFTGLSVTNTVKASHVAAGDIVYRQIDTFNALEYEFTLRFYRECDGIGAPPTITPTFFSPCFGQVNFPAFDAFLQDTVVGNGGGIVKGSNCILDDDKPCTEEYLYRDTITLPGKCDFWTASWAINARPPNDNLASSPTFYVQVEFNNNNINSWDPTFGLNTVPEYYNNSPEFNNDEPVSSFCIGRQYQFDLSATDPDGDSLSYKIVPALSGFGQQVNYAAGYTGNDPLPTVNRPVNLNERTGVLTFTPAIKFQGTLAYEVEEWKDSLYVDTLPDNSTVTKSKKVYRGALMRDLRIAFGEFCNDSVPVFSNLLGTGIDPYQVGYKGSNPNVIAVNCASYYIDIELDIDILCNSIELFGSDLRLTDSTTTPPTIYAIDSVYPTDGCRGLKTNKIRIKLFEPLGLPAGFDPNVDNDGGVVKMYLKPGDDFNTWKTSCGIELPDSTVIDIFVINNLSIDLGDDLVYCNPENPFPLLTAPVPGAERYTWMYRTTPTGARDTVGDKYTQIGDTTGYWGVSLDYSGCQAEDFIFIQEFKTILVEIPDFDFCYTSPYPTIYMGNLLDSGAVKSTYQWKGPKGDIIGIDTSLLIPANGEYTFQVSIPPCTINDTFVVRRINKYDVFLGGDTLICEGEQYELSSGFDYQNDSIFDIEWYLNGNLLADTIDKLMITTSGLYEFRLNSLSGCEGIDSIFVEIAPFLEAPVISCGLVLPAGKQYIWDSIPGAVGYEYSVDGINWTPISVTPSPNPALGNISTLIPGLGTPQVYIRAYNAVPVGTKGGCRYSPATLTPDCEVVIIVPNTFTPNGDGVNDELFLGLIDIYPGNQLTIYNRWGRVVLDVSNYKNDWEAKDLESGTYFYVLDLNDDQQPIQKGTIMILR